MRYLTRAEYAALKGISRQAVEQRIKRGTLPTVTLKMDVERIPVEDIELEGVKPM